MSSNGFFRGMRYQRWHVLIGRCEEITFLKVLFTKTFSLKNYIHRIYEYDNNYAGFSKSILVNNSTF